nr:toprim domain-containing protein [Campylobacter vulpis]
MRLFIAEKPELGRAIAEGLEGSYKSGEGYIQKGNDIITWAFGHILELAKPEEYDENISCGNLRICHYPLKNLNIYLRKIAENSSKSSAI